MRAAHTLGPLEARKGSAGHFCIYIQGTTHNVAVGLREADARFFVAAPTLAHALAKLSGAVQAIRNGERNGAVFGMLSAADDEAREALALAGVKP